MSILGTESRDFLCAEIAAKLSKMEILAGVTNTRSAFMLIDIDVLVLDVLF